MNQQNKNSTSLKSMRLKSEVVEKIENMAKEQNRTFTNMVETILIQETQRNQISAL